MTRRLNAQTPLFARLVLVAAFALLLAFSGGIEVAESQSSTALVSNLTETTHLNEFGVGSGTGTTYSQGFTTGSNSGGYLFTGVSVGLASNFLGATESVTFKIYDSESDGTPRNEVFELTTPTLTSNSTVVFAAPAGAILDPSKNYHVVFQGTASSISALSLTTTSSDAQTGDTGWSIEDAYRINEALAGTAAGLAIQMAVHGTAVSTFTSNIGLGGSSHIDAGRGAAHNIVQGFNTGTHPAGYLLTGVRMSVSDVSLAANERPAIHIYNSNSRGQPWQRVYVLKSPPQYRSNTIHHFTAPAGTKLEPNTRYHVAIQGNANRREDFWLNHTDSDDQNGESGWDIENTWRSNTFLHNSSTSFQMAIHGLQNNAPTGAPTISGDATINSTLTADTSKIADADGLTNATYSYQWLRYEGDAISDEEEISGETGTTYRLTQEDVGKRFKFRVSFVDDNSIAETLTSDAFPSDSAIVDTRVLVSNKAETTHGSRLLVGNATGTSGSQGFRTGSNSAGYLFTGVSVVVSENNFSGSEAATFKIYDSEGDGTPRNALYSLFTPTLTAGSTAFFAAPEGTRLDPNKNYHVVFEATGNVAEDLKLQMTASDAETGETGWTIENVVRLNESLYTNGLSVKMEVHGTSLITTFVDNLTRSAGQELEVGSLGSHQVTQGFVTGSHAAGYRLTGVNVRMSTNNLDEGERPSFKIFNSNSNGQPWQEIYALVTPSEIPSHTIVHFAAPAGAKLEPDTRYHLAFQGSANNNNELKVSTTASDSEDGEAGWSIENNLRFDRTPQNVFSARIGIEGVLNSAATGDLSITGEAFIDRTMTADTSAIMDADGLQNVSYSYQWLRVDEDGTSNQTPITNATRSTYTLTSSDSGKKVKVRVSFTDDNSIAEERTSEAFPATGTVSDDTLVSNLTEARASSELSVAKRTGTSASQGFSPGGNRGGYQLSGVSVIIHRNVLGSGDSVTFKIYDSDPDGTPRNEIYELTSIRRGVPTGRAIFLAAPEGAILQSGEKYHVVFQGTSPIANNLTLRLTESDDQTGETGWGIEDEFRLTESPVGNGNSVKIRIHGREVPLPPLVSNLAETTYSTSLQVGNTDGTQITQGFGTGTNASGYLLTGVSVVIADNNFTGAETTTLKIYDSEANGTPKNAIHTLTTPTLTEGATVLFTAPDDAKLDPDTNYHVVFQSASDQFNDLVVRTTTSNAQFGQTGWTIEDAHRLNETLASAGFSVKIGIQGFANRAATGEPTISGDAFRGGTLTADTSAIGDADGLSNVSYTYQWIRVDADGTSNQTPITGATGSTYTLTSEDEGNRVRVRVSFTDDYSFQEERTSDAYPSTGTVPPTLVSNLAETTLSTSQLNVGDSTGTARSQGFGTGSHASGYQLAGVSVAIDFNNFSGAETATFKIYDSENDGTPRSEVYTLITPTLTEGSTVFFAAPSGAMLDPNENYHVVFQGTGSSNADLKLDLTTSNAQTGETGWTIEDALRFNEDLINTGRSVKMGIHGFSDIAPPEVHDSTAPALAADGKTLTITFNEAMKTTSVPATSAFTVKATPMGGSEETLALATSGGVSVSGSTAVLKMEKPIAHNDGSVKVSYTKPGSGASLQDANGNELASFPDTAVTNNSTIPRVSISTTNTDWTPTLAHADFTLTRSNTDSANDLYVDYEITGVYTDSREGEISLNDTTGIIRPSYSGNLSGAVTLTVVGGDDHLPALAPNNAATVQLKTPATGNYVTISHGLTSHSLTEGVSVTYSVNFVAHAGVAQPRDPIGVVVSSNFNTGTASSGDDFAPVTESITIQPADWTASGQEWKASERITLQTIDDDEYEGNETLTLSLQAEPGSHSKVTWAPGTDVATFTIGDNDTLGVTGITVTSTPTDDYYSAGNAILFEVAFNGSVTVTGTPRLAFDIGGQSRYASYIGGSDTNDLSFSYTVTEAGALATSDVDDHDGISWAANALERNGGTIKFTSTEPTAQVDATLNHVAQSALPAQKVDTQKPTLVSAAATASTLTLTYSEELNTTAPAVSAFSVTVNAATAVSPSAVSITGKEVSLTLTAAVSPGDTVTLTYTKPTENPLKDLSGKEADALSAHSVMTAPPKEVAVRFDQAAYSVDEGNTVNVIVRLDKDPERTVSIPIVATNEGGAVAADYTVPAEVIFSSGETQKSIVFTAVDDPVDDEGEAVSLSFGTTLPPAVNLGSPTQTRVSIDDEDDPLTVTDITVGSTPTNSLYVSGNAIQFLFTFSGPVAVDTAGGTPEFEFDIAGGSRKASYVSGTASTALTFSYTVVDMDGEDRDGISWGADALSDNGGSIKYNTSNVDQRIDAVLDHVAQTPLSDHRVDTIVPGLERARVVDTVLTLDYHEDLNTTAPAASVFSVTVDSNPAVTPTDVSVAGRVVTLTLGTGVMPGQTVTMNYTKPNTNAIKDIAGNEAESLSGQSVLTDPPKAVVLQFGQSSYSVDEGGTVDVIISLDKDPERTVIVPVVATNERGAVAADYTVAESVIFVSGETEKTLVFTATDDPVDDEGERVKLTFGTLPTAVSKGSTAETLVRINDDDDPLTVQSIDVTSSPANGYYLTNGVIQFTMEFTGPVLVDGTSGTPYFEFELAGGSRQAFYTSGNFSSTLLFSYTVVAEDGEDRDGISWNADAINLGGGTMKYNIQESGQTKDAVLNHDAQSPLSGHKVDTIKPMLVEASVDDSELYLEYHEDLDTTAPAASAFSVTVDGGSPANPTAVSIADDEVTLTLANAVAKGATVTVSYTKPSGNPISDPAGNEADGFSGQNVVPASDVENLSAAPGNRTVTLTWDRLVDSELTRYQYRYMNTNDSDWNPDWTNVPGSSASTTSFRARNLTNGLMYTFEIRPVYTRGGQAEPGREGDVDAAPRGAMVAPRNFEADPGNEAGVLLLSWDDPRDVTITGYEYRHRTLTDGNWNPDWTAIANSGPTTTTHTLEKLTWEVLYTVELRALRGIEMGPEARAQGTPPEDLSRPSSLRDVNVVTRGHARLQDDEVLITYREPERLGNKPQSALARIEYRHATESEVIANLDWHTAPAHLLDDRFFIVRGLTVGELHTFQVRAVNDDNKDGSITTVQATPCCADDTQPPTPTAPSNPDGASATSGKVYTETVEVGSGADIRYARSAFVDVTLTWGSSSDQGNAVAGYEYRWSEGSSVRSSAAWLSVGSAGNKDLSIELLRLKPGTRYAFEVRSVTSHGTSAGVATARLTTTSYTGPHYTLSASSSVSEGQAVTITVSRSNRSDGASTVLIQIVDDAELTGYPTSYPTPGVVFGSGDSRATTTFTVSDDNLNTTARKLKVRIAEVASEGSSIKENTNNTFSAAWRTVNVTDTTP